MTTEETLVSEVRRLLISLSGHGVQHMDEVESDLRQTVLLLGAAIEQLCAHFMAIHEAVSAQQHGMDTLLASMGASAECAENLKARQAEITRHVNAAVTGLQFQDLTSQLLGRTAQRIEGLRDVLLAVGSGGAGLAEQRVPEMTQALYEMNTILEARSRELDRALLKTVCQTRMESGDVELF